MHLGGNVTCWAVLKKKKDTYYCEFTKKSMLNNSTHVDYLVYSMSFQKQRKKESKINILLVLDSAHPYLNQVYFLLCILVMSNGF